MPRKFGFMLAWLLLGFSALRAQEPAVDTPAPAGAAAGRWTQTMGQPPVWPDDLGAIESCDAIRADLARLCAVADQRLPELREQGGACTLLEQLGGELAANPPDLSSELRSYDALLGNVFHLFRAVGRERMGALRRVVAERDLAEPAALALYRWAVHHRRCGPTEGPRIDTPALYAYSGFVFNTMGGQAYLRRRSPHVEALVCFYALEALDRAIAAGHNPEGLDPRREISRCRELVGSEAFVFAERYVERLDAMARRWEDGRP